MKLEKLKTGLKIAALASARNRMLPKDNVSDPLASTIPI